MAVTVRTNDIYFNNTAATFTTPPGNAPIFACRAWVNFDGTNAAIRAQGNVSSVVRNGTGDYSVNFAVWPPDASYAAAGYAYYSSADNADAAFVGFRSTATSGFGQNQIRFRVQSNGLVFVDAQIVTIVIFR